MYIVYIVLYTFNIIIVVNLTSPSSFTTGKLRKEIIIIYNIIGIAQRIRKYNAYTQVRRACIIVAVVAVRGADYRR